MAVMKKPNDHAQPTKVERYKKIIFFLRQLELLVLLGCEYGYKPIDNSTYIHHINNLNRTTGVHKLNLTAGVKQKLTPGTQNRTLQRCITRNPYN